ncbi:hypothetical protein ARMA_2948 [Ardenticatena maritima]|uniref:Uncharacterized protein n=1 Tax=Ardenticatena maritima TaxID=872965 RepID=A0A0M8K9J0_9CHLR|nr:hypothetical protein ARMA_2948 [Ardenticatena maritima]
MCLKSPNPRKGIETHRIRQAALLLPKRLKSPNPRKGIETFSSRTSYRNYA